MLSFGTNGDGGVTLNFKKGNDGGSGGDHGDSENNRQNVYNTLYYN